MDMKLGILLLLSLLLIMLGCGSDNETTGPDNGGNGATISLTLIGSLSNQAAGDVIVIGDTAYLAGGNRILTAVDVTDRVNPQMLGYVTVTGNESPTALAVSGNYAYVAAESDGVIVVDITAADSPFVAHKFLGPYAKDIVVQGDYAFVADQDFGLRILDISNPLAPTLAGSCAGDGPFGLAVSGVFAHCADNDSGFSIIDISDPTSPTEVGRFLELYSPRQIEVQGNYAYVQADTAIVVFDVSNPAQPASLGSYTIECRYLAVEANIAFITTGYRRSLVAVDVSDPSRIRMLDSISTPTMPYGLYVDNEFVYVAASDQFLIYEK